MLEKIFHEPLTLVSYYVFFYPLVMNVVWVMGGLYFWWRRERRAEKSSGFWPDIWPSVTVLVPCHNEAESIAKTCDAISRLNYPDYRAVFIDDASTDNTAEIIRSWVDQVPYFYLLILKNNQGKAGALNCALSTAVNTGITVVVDADTLLGPETLEWLVSPFMCQPRLGAVTGNPMALNRSSILEKVQAAEFASIIGLIKRSQRVLGRILTVSGCVAAYRTDVLKRVGGFSSRTATEDIDVTWLIQRHFYEVWFAPQAVVFIQVPQKFKEFWKRRSRWALGGWHLLRTHKDVFTRWRWRRLWPVYIEFVLGYIWACSFVIGSLLYATCMLFKQPLGFSPIPAWHGAVISVACMVQFVAALIVSHRYEPMLWRTFFWVPWYPLFFFVFGSLTVVQTTFKGLFGRLEYAGRWKSPARYTVMPYHNSTFFR